MPGGDRGLLSDPSRISEFRDNIDVTLGGVVSTGGHGWGRELFAGFRRNALSAEEGACSWL